MDRLWVRDAMTTSNQLFRVMNSIMMYEFDALEQISANVAKNRLKEDLEVEVQHMDVKANKFEIFDVGQRINIKLKPPNDSRSTGMENIDMEVQRLDCIYENEPLGFEKDPVT